MRWLIAFFFLPSLALSQTDAELAAFARKMLNSDVIILLKQHGDTSNVYSYIDTSRVSIKQFDYAINQHIDLMRKTSAKQNIEAIPPKTKRKTKQL